MVLTDPASHFDPAGFGHLDIENGNVRLMLLDEFHRLLAVVGFGNHIDIICLLEELANAGPYYSMIVSEEHADLG
jgi:hypothetical protein